MNDNWLRASKRLPCPICLKPDWCLVTRDGSAAICQRVQDGAVCRRGDAGWLHILTNVVSRKPRRSRSLNRRIPIRVLQRPAPMSKLAELVQQFRSHVTTAMLRQLAAELDVSTRSLRWLRVGWDGDSWTFPMVDSAGRVVGIRRRLRNGRKLSLKGGHEGLFVPERGLKSGKLLICEGPTDTAAMLDLGFDAIGRPSCTGGTKYVIQLAWGRHAVIVADADAPGRRGAARLALTLALFCPTVRTITPPAGIKDARSWKQAGASRANILMAIKFTPALRSCFTQRK